MSNRLYDPWDDAALLASQCQSPHNRLIVVLGAAWCSKCQHAKTWLVQNAPKLPPHLLPVWLDLEEHAEFLGDYLPDDLPEMLVYRADTLVQRAVLVDLDQFDQYLHAPDQHFPAASSPAIAHLLTQQNWCQP